MSSTLSSEWNTMTAILQNFYSVFTGGVDALTDPVMGLLWSLMALSLAVNHLLKLEEGNHLSMLVLESIKFGIFIWIVEGYPKHIEQILNFFIQAGSTAGVGGGGQAITAATLMDPSKIAAIGWDVTHPAFRQLEAFSLMGSNSLLLQMTAMATAVLIIICYTVIAIQVFLTFLEFYVIGALALVLLPFGVLKHTSFLGEKAIGAICAAGVKIMVLAFVLSAALPMIQAAPLSAKPGFQECFNLIGGCLCVVFLCLKVPGLAAGLMSGSPTLSGGAAVGTAAAGVSAVGTGYSIAKGAGAFAVNRAADAVSMVRAAAGWLNRR